MTVQVIEGDAPDPVACSLLGQVPHHGPAGRCCPRARPIEVTYAFDAAGPDLRPRQGPDRRQGSRHRHRAPRRPERTADRRLHQAGQRVHGRLSGKSVSGSGSNRQPINRQPIPMAKEIDVYREWLGITETARPLNHYQIAAAEAVRGRRREDPDALPEDERARPQVRRGRFRRPVAAVAQRVGQGDALPDRRRSASANTTRRWAGPTRANCGGGRFEEILLANKMIDQTQLDKARSYAKAVGLEVRDAVVQQKLATPDVVMLAYAESIGLPYVELDDIGVAEDLVPLIPPATARQHSCVPVMADENQMLMASPNPLVPDVEEDLRLRLGKTIRTVLCTPASINAVVAKYYPPDAVVAVAVAKPKASQPAAAEPAKAVAAKPKSDGGAEASADHDLRRGIQHDGDPDHDPAHGHPRRHEPRRPARFHPRPLPRHRRRGGGVPAGAEVHVAGRMGRASSWPSE